MKLSSVVSGNENYRVSGINRVVRVKPRENRRFYDVGSGGVHLKLIM